MKCLVSNIGKIEYKDALDLQNRLASLRYDSKIPDVLLLLEHPHVYTYGRRFNECNLLYNEDQLNYLGITLFSTDRGGDITYHGPGQLVGYPIMEVGSIGNIRNFLYNLEEVIIQAARHFDVEAERLPGYPGVWVNFEKLASVGLRISKGISKHGFALNVSTDLTFFNGIIPCGLKDKKVTSLSKILGYEVSFSTVIEPLIYNFSKIFNVNIVPVEYEDLLLICNKCST